MHKSSSIVVAALCALIAAPLSLQANAIIYQESGTESDTSQGFTIFTSWTQTNTYVSVVMTADLRIDSGSGQVNIYLTDSVGSGTTALANEIANNAITISNTSYASQTLLSLPSLGPGTYYLTLQLPALGWWATDFGAGTITTDIGVTANDGGETNSPAPYPPASTTFNAKNGWIVSVTGSAAPEPATFSIIAASLIGLAAIVRRRVR